MNLKSQTDVFDGVTFTTMQFPAFQGLKLVARLVKVAGPTLAAMAQGGADLSNPAAVLPQIAESLLSLDTDEAVRLCMDLLKNTSAVLPGGATVPLLAQHDIDLVFSGRLKVLFDAIVVAIKVNFSDFFPAGAMSAPQPKAPSEG